MTLMSWRVVHGGKTPPPGEVVRPDERLSWPRTIGLGAQHVVAMFGATFVFPIIMGLNPQLAIMMSGIATICFLLIVQGRVPSYLGTSASFVGGVVAIRQQAGDSADVTGAILIAGLVLAACGVAIHFLGSRVLHAVLPPVVTGAVVMLIGFNLAPVVANIYWPQDQWVALLTMVAVTLMLPAASQEARAQEDPLKRSQQILAEEQRQHYVGQNLDSVSKQFLDLIDDLRSNGLMDADQAQELRRTVGVLQTVGNQHVQKAGEEFLG